MQQSIKILSDILPTKYFSWNCVKNIMTDALQCLTLISSTCTTIVCSI